MDRVSYLRKPLDPSNDHSVKAYRLYLKFIYGEIPVEYSKVLKTKRSGVDLHIPSDEEILSSLNKAREIDERLYIVYKLLVESGARLVEVVNMLKKYGPSRDKRHGSFYTYEYGLLNSTKKAFYIFHITPIFKTNIPSDKWVSDKAKKHRLVRPKYIRKWVSMKMISLGIDRIVVDFIQGRTPRSVLERNYLDRYILSLNQYPKYIEHLKSIGLA